MNHGDFAAPDLQGAFAVTAPETNKPTRLTNEQRNSLYIAAYSSLRDLCYENYPNLICTDCETILETLAGRLPQYKGSPEPAAFLKWASKFVRREAQRYEITERILRQYRAAIFWTINQHMYTSAQDRSIEADDLFVGIADYIFEHAHSFNKPGYLREDGGNVKLLTRLCALAKKHTFLYYNSPQTTRKRSIEANFAKGKFIEGCELLSEAEVAALRPPESAWDAGYSSLGMLE